MKAHTNTPYIKSLTKQLLGLVVLSVIFTACNKNKLPKPLDATKPSVYFYAVNNVETNTADTAFIDTAFSNNYSFFFVPASSKTDTLTLPQIHIAGRADSKPRTINLVALDSSTAVAGTHYRILNNTMPAGAYSTTVKVAIYHTPDLDTKTVKLYLKLEPNADFPAATKDSVTAGYGFYFQSNYKIMITALPIQPKYWIQAVYSQFGIWSKVKYQFIIDNTGLYVGLTPQQADLYNLALKLRSALIDYNSSHTTPLTDENGHPVNFLQGSY